jgi:DNA-binding NarL/FixJ family response regulator
MRQILIVEDNVAFRQLLKQILSLRFPFLAIDEASDGAEALLKINAASHDLVFTDIRLPGVNGLDLTRQIKRLDDQITVIVLSSDDLPEYQEAAYRSGANYFLSKGTAKSSDILDLVARLTSNENGSMPLRYSA